MLKFLKKIFSRKPKVTYGGSSFIGTYVGSAPKDDVTVHTERDLKVEDTASLPMWYIENCNFEELQFMNHSASLTPPTISPQARAALKTYVQDVCPEPSSALIIYQKLNGKDVSVRDAAKLVATDPLLAAQVLRVVNSAAFYTPTEVKSVGRAVTLLGLHNVRSIVLSNTISSSMGAMTDKAMFTEVIQEHSAMVSSIAMNLSENRNGVNQYEASTIGLMHDIGKILYPLILEKGKKIITNMDIPTEIMESLLASTFAEIWGLPNSIVYAIQYTSYPFFYTAKDVPAEYQKLVALVASANLLAKALGFSDGEMHYSVEESFSELIGLTGPPEFWLTPGIVVMIEKSRQSLR